MKNLIERLRQYSESLVAYKLGADFADAVKSAADMLENHASDRAALSEEIEKLRKQLEQTQAERDAAVSDIAKIARGGKTWMCPYCKHGRDTGHGFADCDIQLGGCKVPFTMFEWRGQQNEEKLHEKTDD